MNELEKQKLKFIKAMYGKDKFEKQEKVQFGDKWISGWYLIGYPTLKEFESAYSDSAMIDIHKQLRGEVIREADSGFEGIPSAV